MTSHPASLTDEDIRNLLDPWARIALVDGIPYVPDSRTVADAQLKKALEWCVEVLFDDCIMYPNGDTGHLSSTISSPE